MLIIYNIYIITFYIYIFSFYYYIGLYDLHVVCTRALRPLPGFTSQSTLSGEVLSRTIIYVQFVSGLRHPGAAQGSHRLFGPGWHR